MKRLVFLLPVLAIAACDGGVPNSGVGFGDYETYLKREAELGGKPAAPAAIPAAESVTSGPISSAPIQNSNAPLSALSTPAPVAVPTGTEQALPAPVAAGAPVAGVAGAPGASDPQAIGADALAALNATAPAGAAAPAAPAAPVFAGESATASSTAVPAAAPVAPVAPAATGGAAGPNLAAYALAAGNAPGQAVYERSGLRLTSPEKACAKFTSSDLAQMAFLEKGGPAKDPLNLDPDGDGFACGWDPRPFQAARP